MKLTAKVLGPRDPGFDKGMNAPPDYLHLGVSPEVTQVRIANVLGQLKAEVAVTAIGRAILFPILTATTTISLSEFQPDELSQPSPSDLHEALSPTTGQTMQSLRVEILVPEPPNLLPPDLHSVRIRLRLRLRLSQICHEIRQHHSIIGTQVSREVVIVR
jgi:hypothetical protein